MDNKSSVAKGTLGDFFRHLNELGNLYQQYTDEVPTSLIINPDIVARMSRIEGFYQREELAAKVTAHSPVVRYFKLSFGVVILIDDWDEKFLHYES